MRIISYQTVYSNGSRRIRVLARSACCHQHQLPGRHRYHHRSTRCRRRDHQPGWCCVVCRCIILGIIEWLVVAPKPTTVRTVVASPYETPKYSKNATSFPFPNHSHFDLELLPQYIRPLAQSIRISDVLFHPSGFAGSGPC